MRFTALIIAVALVQLSFAGTVTLTGTCPASLSQSSNYISFNITNSGTDPALNMLITPNFTGFSTYNKSETIPVLGPAQTVSRYFYIYNFSYPGTYAEAFTAKYGQGGSTFYAVFPCPVSIGRSSQAGAAITSVKQGSGGTLNVTVSNPYSISVDAVLDVIAPPTISMTPKSRSVVLAPGSQQNFSFSFMAPTAGQSLTTAVALSYLQNGTHYASLMDYVIVGSGSQAPQAGGGSDQTVIVGIAAVIAIILILIVLSIKKGMGGNQQPPLQQPQQPPQTQG